MEVDFAVERPIINPEASALFRAVFTASEDAGEGALIGGLVEDLLTTTQDADLVIATARQADALAGCILFTRLRYDDDVRQVFLLSPVAVRSDLQGLGIGRALIRHGLAALRARGVDIVVTYGDPAYYAKTGFRPVTMAQVPPPHPLQQPDGWIAQSLSGGDFDPLRGAARCVPGFDNPAVW